MPLSTYHTDLQARVRRAGRQMPGWYWRLRESRIDLTGTRDDGGVILGECPGTGVGCIMSCASHRSDPFCYDERPTNGWPHRRIDLRAIARNLGVLPWPFDPYD